MNKQESDKKKIILAIIFFLLLLLLMCLTAMMSKYNDSVDPEDYDTDPPAINEEDINDDPTPTPTVIEDSDETDDTDSVNWLTYTNNDPSYSFNYPSGWILDSTEAEYDGDDIEIKRGEVKVIRDDYVIHYSYFVGPSGPSVCYYPDSEDKSIMISVDYDNYVELTTKSGKIFRRSIVEQDGKTYANFCLKSSDGGYVTPITNGFLYQLPDNPSNEMLLEMDMIVEYNNLP